MFRWIVCLLLLLCCSTASATQSPPEVRPPMPPSSAAVMWVPFRALKPVTIYWVGPFGNIRSRTVWQ